VKQTSFKLNPFNTRSEKTTFIAVTAVVTVITVIGSVYLYTRPSSTSRPQAVIEVTAHGFVPETLAVKAGTQVVWKNTDSAPHAVASNPYPANSSVPGLSSKTILPGGSYTYTAANTGKIEYHDNTQPVLGGTIMVER
jgi:plastocyanin